MTGRAYTEITIALRDHVTSHVVAVVGFTIARRRLSHNSAADIREAWIDKFLKRLYTNVRCVVKPGWLGSKGVDEIRRKVTTK